jgi:hypothetical protein
LIRIQLLVFLFGPLKVLLNPLKFLLSPLKFLLSPLKRSSEMLDKGVLKHPVPLVVL